MAAWAWLLRVADPRSGTEYEETFLDTGNRDVSRLYNGFHDETAGHADRVGDEISPVKALAENQMADGGVAKGDQPGRLTEFEGFDGAGGCEGQYGNAQRRGLAKEKTPAEEDHQRPQGVTRIFSEEGREKAGETTGGETGRDGRQHCEEIAGSGAEAWLEER
jgi:hypothetical protein